MIYFQNATTKNKVVELYKENLPSNLRILYEKICEERLKIYYYGYILGFILSIIIIIIINYKKRHLTNLSMICIIIVVSFSTNYFYYILSPKTTYMLDHINNQEQSKAWLTMYRSMQVNYHIGLVLGIIAVGLLGFAFRK
jgi:uncharacterized membrane protein YkgB